MSRIILPPLVSSLLLIGCGSPTAPQASPEAPTTPVATVPAAPPAPVTTTPLLDEDMESISQLVHPPRHVVFDLQALHRKNITQIRQLLGAPDWDDSDPHQGDGPDPQPSPKEWDKTYSRDSIMLNIRYFYRTGKVKYFYLEPQYGCVDATPAGVQALLAAGNLTPTSRQYRSVPVYYKHKATSHRYSSIMLAPR